MLQLHCRKKLGPTFQLGSPESVPFATSLSPLQLQRRGTLLNARARVETLSFVTLGIQTVYRRFLYGVPGTSQERQSGHCYLGLATIRKAELKC